MNIQSPFTCKRYAKELKNQYPFVTDEQASSMAMLAINGWVFNGQYSEKELYCAMIKNEKVFVVYQNGDF